MKLLRLKKTDTPLPAAPIRLFLGDQSFELVSPNNSNFYRRLKHAMKQIPECWGPRLPEIELCHLATLPPQAFRLEIAEIALGEGQLESGRLLALGDEESLGPLLGTADHDPIYGLPSKWILPSQARQAEERSCLLMSPETIIITLLTERLPAQLYKLLSFDETHYLVEKWREREPILIEESLKRFGLAQIFRLLRGLLEERVPVGRLDLVLQGALRSPRKRPGPELVELARQALSQQICQLLLDQPGSMAAIVLANWVEKRWEQELNRKTSVEDWFFQRFGHALELLTDECWAQARRPLLVVGSRIRAELSQLLRRTYPDLPVLSWAEISPEVEVETIATLGSQVHPLACRWPSRCYVSS